MADIQVINLKTDIIQPILEIQENLNNNIISLKNKIAERETYQDIRIVSLENIKLDIVRFGFIFHAIYLSTNNEENFEVFKNEIKNNRILRNIAQKEMNDYLRLSIITTVNFKVEYLLSSLIKNQNNENIRGYEKIINKIKDITNSSNEDLNVLKAFSYMRNCFHNNGIHNDKNNLNCKINNIDYNFIRGNSIDYSIEKVLVLLTKSIEIVCEWINKPPFSDISEEIVPVI